MASYTLIPTTVGKVWDSRILLYDLDNNNGQQLLKIRTLKRDGNDNTMPTVTPLYAARFVTDNPMKVPPRAGLNPRSLSLCYPNPNNATGRTVINVYVPYSPDKPEWKEQIRETFNLLGATSIDYRGESKPITYTSQIN